MGSPKKFLSLAFLFGLSLDPVWEWFGYKEVIPEIQETPKSIAVQKTYYYLSSIIYCAPNKWSIWLNDKKYTPQTPHPNKNIKVFFDHVKYDEVPIFPDQTLELPSKTVQDGDSRFDAENNHSE